MSTQQARPGARPSPQKRQSSGPSAARRQNFRTPRANGPYGRTPEQRLATGLGWFSIGLGLTELLAPRTFARLIGVRPRPILFPLLGVRELISGVGILSRPRPSGSVWSRVAGDAMDLTLLGLALADHENDHGRLTAATAAVVGVTALDSVCASQLTKQHDASLARGKRSGGGIQVVRSAIVNRPIDEVYRFWRNFENFPQFMRHVQSVRVTDDKRSHWMVRGPAGSSFEWEAEILRDQPESEISWRTLPGSGVEHSGTVVFEKPTDMKGTIVHVEFEYKPPAGAFGAAVASLFGEEAEQQVADDLRRFKQVIETGEVPTIEGQTSCRANYGLNF